MRDSDNIEGIANNFLDTLLRNIFNKNSLKLIPHPSGKEEIGIDFFYQVMERENDEQVLFFEIQNKGTDTPPKVIKQNNHQEKGKIGFSLELRHIKQYYYQLDEPLIFVLCDINNSKAYWYSIQLDKSIPNRIKEREEKLALKSKKPKKPKLRIYVPSSNIINEENFEKFLKEIESSKHEQIRKNNDSLISEADFTDIEKEIDGMHIIDQAFLVINKFNGINVFPTSLIPKLPFLTKTKYGARLDGFSLTTNHSEFFDLIKNITLVDKKLVYSKGKNLVDKQELKLKTIVNFLKANYIRHLQWGGRKYRKRICVHDICIYNNCNCARCNFDDLNFKKSKSQIISGLTDNNLSLFEQLRNAYAAYLLGDLKTAAQIFNKIYDISYREENLVISSICKYNLKKLKRLVENNYFQDDREQIIESIKFDDLSNDEVFIKRKAPYFLDVFYWLRDDKFYSTATWKMDGFVEESKKIHFYDKHGTSYSHEKTESIIASFIRFYSFLEYNFIIFDYFADYNRLATKFLECVLALSNIVNPESSRYEKFSLVVIKMWLFYVPMDKAKNLMHIYNITKITPSSNDELITTFEELSSNLLKSANLINNSKSHSYFISKVKRIISNFFLICSRLDSSKEGINRVISKMFEAIKKIEHVNFVPFEGISQLLKHRDDISKENISTIIDICLKYENRSGSYFSLAVKDFVENSNSDEIKDFVFKCLNVSNIDKETKSLDEKKIESIAYAISSLDEKYRKLIKRLLLSSLQENFSPRLYYIVTVFDLIDFEPLLFSKFVDSVPDHSKEPHAGSLFGAYENYRFNQVVNITFKYNLPITNEVKNLIDKSSEKYKDYYKWLLDIDNYEYSKFQPIWILKHNTKFYIERFKKSDKLKKEIKKSLKEEYVEGVAQFYIEHLT